MTTTSPADIAAELDSRLPGWVVIWSPYHRQFTAFGACTPEATVIDDPAPERLLDRMRSAQLAALSRAKTDGR
jgi:hypothetical protein